MTDGGAAFEADQMQMSLPYRQRSGFTGHEVFGQGEDAILVDPGVTRDLRSAAESATQEGRIAGGLLYGRFWVDDEGEYVVVDGFLEAGPGENPGDRISRDGPDSFTLSDADLRLLREDAARMYSSAFEAGWWRSLPAVGEFGPLDLQTQAELVDEDGVGLLVFGSGPGWGIAYQGPEAQPLIPADPLAAASRLVAEPELATEQELEPEFGIEEEPEPAVAAEPALEPEPVPPPEVIDIAAGESLLQEPPAAPAPVTSPATSRLRRARSRLPGPGQDRPRQARQRQAQPRQDRPRVRRPTRVRMPRVRAAGPAEPGYSRGPETPADVQFVVGALIAATVAAAIIIGVLVSSTLVALIIGAIGVLAIFSTVWLSRH